MKQLSHITCGIADKRDGALLEMALRGLYDRMSTQAFNSGAIAVGTTTTKVNLAAAIHGIVKGKAITVPITNDFWNPSTAVIATSTTNVCCFYIDSTGAASSAFGTAGATGTAGVLNANVKFPPIPEGKIMAGFAIISAVGATWTGRTDNFATSGGNYTVVLVNTVGMFDPTATI